jgi:N-acyl-L-homoserine lactone synthetase
MTNLTDVVAKERITEAAAKRLAGIAEAARPQRDAAHAHTEPRGRLVGALSTLGMPFEEIRAVLRATEPVVVARYMELHRERLAENLADRIRELEALERILARRSRAALPKR